MDYLALGGLMLDDIVFPDGRTAMGNVGGSGVYAAAGMRAWSERVGVFGRVDEGFGAELLAPFGLTMDAVVHTRLPTPRAWQLYEADGQRTQVWRVPDDVWQRQLAPTVDDLPPLDGVRGVHLAARGLPGEAAVVDRILTAGATLSVEPVVYPATPPERRARVLETARRATVFSPGEAEMHLLFDATDDVDALAALGCPHAVLRRGARGSVYVGEGADAPIPAPPAAAHVVDVTGAGNAFCGGFLVGWCEQHDVTHALACAAASAAKTLEQIGPPPLL